MAEEVKGDPLARAAHLTPELLERLSRPTLLVEEAGRLVFDIGRAASYSAARKGQIPTIKIGRKLFVPTWKLREMLGLSEAQKAA